jgi:pilus assembly protein CpaE
MIGADEVIIVAGPDLANLRNAKTMLDALRQSRPNDKPPKVILNCVGVPRRPEIATSDFAKAIEIDPAAIIPFEPKLFGTAANNGQMIAEVDPNAEIVQVLDDLGRKLMGKSVAHRPRMAFLQPLLERFRKMAG